MLKSRLELPMQNLPGRPVLARLAGVQAPLARQVQALQTCHRPPYQGDSLVSSSHTSSSSSDSDGTDRQTTPSPVQALVLL
ncbi:unnamed protein product [Linum trigynum]|uniref:Uncharacterized protein n=1 Tax=Linum trigynum TaxID=586398 RepID=A0AAV2EQZ7_9ROSI